MNGERFTFNLFVRVIYPISRAKDPVPNSFFFFFSSLYSFLLTCYGSFSLHSARLVIEYTNGNWFCALNEKVVVFYSFCLNNPYFGQHNENKHIYCFYFSLVQCGVSLSGERRHNNGNGNIVGT